MTSDSFERRYAELNDEQRRAVDTIEGPVLVVAGPGSGKTEVLAMRAANILRRTDTAPSSVLCLSFTDAAAANMRARLAGLIGSAAYKMPIHTFHGFCSEVMGRFPEFFYKGGDVRPIGDAARMNILQGIFAPLPHNNPLSSQTPDGNFTYLPTAIQWIENLKKAGLSPDDFRGILDENERHFHLIYPMIGEIAALRIGKGSVEAYERLASDLRRHAESHPASAPGARSLFLSIAGSLSRAITAAKESGKNTPLSEWKRSHISKNDAGAVVLKDALYIEKLRALADVYAAYASELLAQGYYDFDDMVGGVVRAAEKHPALLYELQEGYHYILVDEFQDTNGAQMKLLHLLGSAAVNEGRPNIMAVGDDDQAIYKFQGADISNILDFQSFWSDPAIIVLTKNYRSRESILTFARRMIVQGVERLEGNMQGVVKELIAVRGKGEANAVEISLFSSPAAEFSFVAREISKMIRRGTNPEEIAVITRKHATIGELLPYLAKEGVPVKYERNRDVIREPHIRQLVAMARFLAAHAGVALAADDVDTLLPEILSFPFWGLSRDAVWRVSLAARGEKYRHTRSRWLAAMKDSEDENIVAIAQFFEELSARAPHDPWELVFGELVGARIIVADEENDDEHDITRALSREERAKRPFTSPFREYYFSAAARTRNPERYVSFLSSLRVFARALREYKGGDPVFLADAVEYFNMYERGSVALSDKSPYAASGHAVELSTVHKAKGREFGTVFVVHCTDEMWTRAGKRSNIPYPINLPIAPAGESDDDHLRLFYVALTRAKDRMMVTMHTTGDDGGAVSPIRFVQGEEMRAPASHGGVSASAGSEGMNAPSLLLPPWKNFYAPPVRPDERALFADQLERYVMSPTHLNTFLDVAQGGPSSFFERHIVQFPEPKAAPMSFGTAMHRTIEDWYAHLRQTGGHPDFAAVRELFARAIDREWMSAIDKAYYLKRGEDALVVWYERKRRDMSPDHIIERAFGRENIVLGAVPVSGKIDLIEKTSEGKIIVSDFKTGKPIERWDVSDPYKKIKLHKYAQQLLFYKLLAGESRDFSSYPAEEGRLVFLEPLRGDIVSLSLSLAEDDAARMRDLIAAVYKKIMQFDFPDVSGYPKNIDGIRNFEEDLLAGNV